MARLFVLLLSCLCLTASAEETLPVSVRRALQESGIPLQSVAVVIQPLSGNKAPLRYQAEQPMNPASLMKLLTTYAALELLGPAYTWRTDLLATTQPESGVLGGDLILRGSGDPKFTYDRLWLLLRELRNRGVKDIRGDLLLDRTAFTTIDHDPAAFDAKPQSPYNVGGDALLFNFATLHLTLSAETGSIRLFAEPLPDGFMLINRLRPSNLKLCGEWREALSAQFAPGQLTISGEYPRSCGEKRWHLAGLPNSQLLQGVFSRLWHELGGEFSGKTREGSTPPEATLLASSESPTLAELVRDINKFSNNVMAQQVYLKVGGGDTANAEQNIRNWLNQKGLLFQELQMENGSGLSRRNRLSAGSLARLLASAWKSPVMPELMASLPIAAIDGTTRKKYTGNGVAGQAHLKTGSLEGVRGIAGYLLDKSGQRHIVVFIVNHPNAHNVQAAFDALLEWLWQGN